MSLVHLIILLIIVIVIAVVIALVMMNQENQRLQRQREVIMGKNAAVNAKRSNKDDPNKRRADIAKKLRDEKEDGLEAKKKEKQSTRALLAQAGLSISVRQFGLMSVLSMVVFTFLANAMGQPIFVVICASVVGLFGFPRFIVKKMAARRQKGLLEEFPDALEATVRLLKAGMPVAEAVAMISKEYDGPVGEEMSRIYDKQKIGIPLHEAALEATYRMPLPEMQMFATGLSIQAQTGSSLSEVLLNLSNVIRSRFRLKRKVKALSSEAVASASIIGALPVLVATGMYFVNYDYISVLFNDPFGNVLLGGAIFWMACGIFVMKVMINFKI